MPTDNVDSTSITNAIAAFEPSKADSRLEDAQLASEPFYVEF
jgi:hypothetical protein